jgi:hypothetical protein
MTNPPDRHTDVLVIGGGLTGLAAAGFLRQHGAQVVLAEQHPTTSLHPKARLVTARSMELYLGLGIDEAIRAAGEPNRGFVVADTLAGEHEAWHPPPEQNGADQDLSPVSAYSCDQQRIEPILAERAEALGAQLYFATRVDTLTDHGDHVSARLTGPGDRPWCTRVTRSPPMGPEPRAGHSWASVAMARLYQVRRSALCSMPTSGRPSASGGSTRCWPARPGRSCSAEEMNATPSATEIRTASAAPKLHPSRCASLWCSTSHGSRPRRARTRKAMLVP